MSAFWFLLLFLPILAMSQQAITAGAVVVVIVVQALLIAGLLFQRSRRWRANRQLAESEHTLAELTGRLLRTQDEERRHIARELHDVTAQSLGLILLNLTQVQSGATTMDEKSKDRMAESVALGEQALKEIRTLSYVLHPPLLDQAGLVTALKWYIKGFSERSGVKIEFSENGDNGQRMSPDVEYALFRVVQECLTNIRRHTNSETADINITRTNGDVSLLIHDHGKAHHLDLPPNGDGIESIGVGIPGMRHRLKQLGGELSVHSNGKGTTVTAKVPVRSVKI